MDAAKFARLARGFAKTLNRRRMVAGTSVWLGLLGQREASAFQLGTGACAELGAVCTLISGCCDGLTCVTSAINTSYGLCVPGDGGMVSTGTTLISPFSETAFEEVSALMETAPTTPSTDPRAERQAHLAEVRAREKTRRSERKTRLNTRRSSKSDGGHKQHSRPRLKLELQFSEANGDGELAGAQMVPIEIVRATNHDDVDVVLTRIESIENTVLGVDLTAPQFTLGPGDSYSFVSGLPTEEVAHAGKDRFQWLDRIACDGSIEREGYRVRAAFSRGQENREFVVFCPRPQAARAIATPAATPRRKRKKHDEPRDRPNSQQQKEKKR
jgi:hypothetical protein